MNCSDKQGIRAAKCNYKTKVNCEFSREVAGDLILILYAKVYQKHLTL